MCRGASFLVFLVFLVFMKDMGFRGCGCSSDFVLCGWFRFFIGFLCGCWCLYLVCGYVSLAVCMVGLVVLVLKKV